MSRKPKKGYFVRGHFVAEGSELDLELKAELKGTPDASRTDQKRESDALQDLGKDLLGEPVLLQQMPKAQDRRLVGDIVTLQLDAGKAAHRLDLVQRVLHRRVRQRVPLLHEVDAQHLLQGLGLGPLPALG